MHQVPQARGRAWKFGLHTGSRPKFGLHTGSRRGEIWPRLQFGQRLRYPWRAFTRATTEVWIPKVLACGLCGWSVVLYY